MKKLLPKYPRILSIAPSTKGFGFALLEGLDTLVDWGVRSVEGEKNSQSLAKVEELIGHYQPDVLVLEDASSKSSRRSERIQTLGKQIISLGASCKVNVAMFSREQVRQVLFADGQGTKYALAQSSLNGSPRNSPLSCHRNGARG
jgi:Holliday junction resolvasome RuvABC endonuclease subunit